MSGLQNVIRVVPRLFHWGGMAAAMAMMLLVVANIVARRIPGLSPIRGTFDMVELISVIMVALFFAQTTAEKRHVALDILFTRLPGAVQPVVRMITSFLSIIVLSLISWRLALRAHTMYVVQQVSPSMHFALFPFYAVAFIGFAVMTLVVVKDFISLWRGKEATG